MREDTISNFNKCVSDLRLQYVQDEGTITKPILSFNADAMDALWRVIRKLSDDGAMLVVHTLNDKKALTSAELHKETNLSGPALNHILFDLKKLNVIIQNRDDKKYHLTNYGEIILQVLWNILGKLSRPNS
jgi:predicted transcriptional regulator